MTLPEFRAALKAFARFHGAKDEAPSEDAMWAFFETTTDRPSIVH